MFNLQNEIPQSGKKQEIKGWEYILFSINVIEERFNMSGCLNDELGEVRM